MEIKEILEKPNVYSFNDECYLYFGDYNKLKDYITDLQQENERLREKNKTLQEDAWRNNANLMEMVKEELEKTDCEECEICEDYKSRIEKAVEYIKEAGCYDEETKTFCDDIWEELPKLLDILNGKE